MKNTEWTDCGEGTMYLEADGKHMVGCTTRVVELKGHGRIFEVYDYSNESEQNFQLLLAAPKLLAALKECMRDVATPISDHPWAVKQRAAHEAAREAIEAATFKPFKE